MVEGKFRLWAAYSSMEYFTLCLCFEQSERNDINYEGFFKGTGEISKSRD